MNLPAPSFALITDPVFGSPATSSPFGGGAALIADDVVLILATGFTLALLLMLWARYGRSRARRDGAATDLATVGSPGRGRRRRRRAPLTRNPTRAETGGLPPMRVDGPPQPSP